MTDDEMMLWVFVIENFACVPSELKRRVTAEEWQKIIIVHRRKVLGVDRRDLGLAKAAAAILGSLTGKTHDLEPLLPVQLWEKPEPTEDDIGSTLDTLASSWPSTSLPLPSSSLPIPSA